MVSPLDPPPETPPTFRSSKANPRRRSIVWSMSQAFLYDIFISAAALCRNPVASTLWSSLSGPSPKALPSQSSHTLYAILRASIDICQL